MQSILSRLLVAFLCTQQAMAYQGQNLEKADEMMHCMVYLLKYKYDDFYSSEEKIKEAKTYEDAAVALSSSDYFNTRIFQIDDQLMMDNMAAIGRRTGKETVNYYDGLVKQCRIKQAEYKKED